jgi:hypothetical protein
VSSRSAGISRREFARPEGVLGRLKPPSVRSCHGSSTGEIAYDIPDQVCTMLYEDIAETPTPLLLRLMNEQVSYVVRISQSQRVGFTAVLA